jgi:hypothetical protein
MKNSQNLGIKSTLLFLFLFGVFLTLTVRASGEALPVYIPQEGPNIVIDKTYDPYIVGFSDWNRKTHPGTLDGSYEEYDAYLAGLNQTTPTTTDQAPTTTQTTPPAVTTSAPQANRLTNSSSSTSNKSTSSDSSSNSSSESSSNSKDSDPAQSSTTTTQNSQNAISKPVAYTAGAIGLSMIGAGLYMYLHKFF